MRHFVYPVGLGLDTNDQMLITADLVIGALEFANQPVGLVLDAQLLPENVKTPPPRFLPIERWISSVNPLQPPNDATQLPVFGAGIFDDAPFLFTEHGFFRESGSAFCGTFDDTKDFKFPRKLEMSSGNIPTPPGLQKQAKPNLESSYRTVIAFIAQRKPTWLLPVSGGVPRRAAGR
jgi:hypothetical protein